MSGSNLQPCTIILECYKTLQDAIITCALDLAEAYIIELAAP